MTTGPDRHAPAGVPWTLPAVPGLISREEIAETALAIEAVQEPSGAVPWAPGDQVDVWNHVEAAMALLVGGRREAADRAYAWVRRTQREDGTWPMKLVEGEVREPAADSNMCAYPAVGVWHHWLVTGDRQVLESMWPVVRRALDVVVGMQLPFGGIGWARDHDGSGPGRVAQEALLTGSSSIYQSLRAGVALAQLMGDPQPEWELAGGRLGHAVRRHPDLFADRSQFSMDWYYPVLGGAVRGEEAERLLDARRAEFLSPRWGIRCVSTNPWATGAETCELVMALAAVGRQQEALGLFAQVAHLRDAGAYRTGYVWPDEAFWPVEHTTYTAAAVVLAADELSRTTPGGTIMRGDSLGPRFEEIPAGCGCAGDRALA